MKRFLFPLTLALSLSNGLLAESPKKSVDLLNGKDLAAWELVTLPATPADIATVCSYNADGSLAVAGKPVSVCGEAAADPMLAAVLVGFGASSLSMSPRALGHVSELLAGVTLAECRAAAAAASAARNSQEARSVAASALHIGSYSTYR